MSEFSEKTTDFAWDLFRTVTTPETTEKNLIFSPASIVLALALVQRGAQKETRNQIGRRLFGDLADDQVEQELMRLIEVLLGNQNQQDDDGVILSVANRLFIDINFQVLDAYLTETGRVFKAVPENLPFSTDGDKAVKHINDWVSKETHGKIKQLIDQLDSGVNLIVANAIYFKVSSK